jgi:hypothetical protein
MSTREKLEYLFLVGALALIFVVFYGFFDKVHFVEYQFYTVSRISNMYDQPIYLSFHWTTTSEVITGEPVEVWAETLLPYTSNPPSKIQVRFEGVGYYDEPSADYLERISEDDTIVLYSTEEKPELFRSKSIELRYAVEGSKAVEFCDYNVSPPCIMVSDVIEVQPRATAFETSIAKIIMLGTFAIYVLTVVLIFYTMRLTRVSSKSIQD